MIKIRLMLITSIFMTMLAVPFSYGQTCYQHHSDCEHFCSMGLCNGCVDEKVCRMAAHNDAHSWVRQGVAAMHKDGAKKAEHCFKLALSYDANNADALYDLGVICEQREDFAGAYQWYQRAHAVNQQDPEINAALQYVSSRVNVSNEHPRISVNPRKSPVLPVSQPSSNSAELPQNNRPLKGHDLACPVCGALNQTPFRAATPLLEQLLHGF